MAQDLPRGATQRPRSGGAAESPRLQQRSSSLEGLPHVGGHGRRPGGATQPKARGCGREELPHAQGAMAALVQEGLEELLHVQGQERH